MGTRTRTVLFTDMADYTAAVARADRRELVRILTAHEEVVAPVVQRYNGRVVKNLGDSFMCLFEAATDAVRAALDLQATLAVDASMNIRVGMTTGDVEEIDGDAFGDAVNLAARILSKTPASEVWFGPGTRVCMNPSELPWEPVGRFSLKGIATEIDVYRAVPQHRCWLPDAVIAAVRKRKLVRIQPGDAHQAPLAPDAVVLLEGFVPGSSVLAEAIARLPVLDPAQIVLSAYLVSPVERLAWTEAGRGLIIGAPAAVRQAIEDAQRTPSRSTGGSDTIVLDGGGADFELVIAGLALPQVPLADVVASYFYDLVSDGRWVNRADSAVVRVEVVPEGPRLLVTSGGVRVDGRGRAINEAIPLRDGMRIEAAGVTHTYRTLSDDYVGALVADTPMRLGVNEGQLAEIGREPNHPGLAFPDRRGQDNIRWCAGTRAERARAGGFTLDRALAGRRQASFELSGKFVVVRPLHDRCTTWIYREGSKALLRVAGDLQAKVGDLVIAGTTVVGLREPELG